ncbi:transcription-repair coupling factor [Conexibacter woesei]|uniref:Transcription-repair-coupling factor n=1 Tax=Conexibacter woesei (strain DSM 14684 / CCUG 47730 / CIP 108061 / JCM 11494 / NBRC 100937 / ID131577) TaxID=469383 RepID=D3FEF5_CONWI|nr:transcription-repair coupling factor [Conexibacter woesei]ADB53647.1 transcription-repair coupling factor [Conexibacter woesei DSM 14684]
MLAPLLAYAADDPATTTLARDGGRAFVSQSLRPFVVAALAQQDPARPLLVVAGDDRQARDLAADMRTWLQPRPVRFYPSRGVAYESHLAPPAHLVGLRVAALDALIGERGAAAPVVVVSAVALSEKVPNPALRPHGFTLRVGELMDLDESAEDLVAAGYERVDQVEDRGQFAIRGGLLDLYPATEDRAVRVDLFGDEIESLRWFSTFTQRSLGDAEEVEVSPAAELAPEHRELAEIAALEDADNRPDIAELLPVGDFHAMLDLVPDAAVMIAAEEEIAPALRDHWQDVCTAFHDTDAHDLYVAPEAVQAALGERARIHLSSIDGGQPLAFRGQAADVAARGVKEAEPELEKLVRSGYRTVVAFGRRGEGDRAAYNLGRMKVRWVDGDAPRGADLAFVEARLRDGFIAPGFRLAVIPEHRLFHRRPARTAGTGTGRRRGALRSFTDLRTGDIVVHEDHGLARFAGFDTKTVAGVTRDYLNLEYAGSDKVFMPVDQFAKISRYVGAGGDHPPLSKLGGRRWDTLKARARRAAQEMAGELLNLYAERKRRAGHAFPPDSDWMREFEDAWPYRETPDQREAIEQVKTDMETARPMDRLICGDVGYGKTEVALRAAFKAANDGRQVMVLVPTTILAQQHYGTFAERLKDYPFTIEHVSRFRPAAEQRAAIRAFTEGSVDILIGTHRLLSRDVRPRDLGLLIVDEEQRFGVKQKELLRQLKLKVDVIAMSATPIPRTLQMSIAGIRDISVIETPPEGRRPVKTYVGEYDEQLVKSAIERERSRGGQAFFLHNRVETIDETAERLRALCPEARFEVAHGQLDEKTLEERMLRFLRGEADVLVATSIIESGIDIPQANTLMVERADLFGLSQLYQIRGRVGRSRERAYAYLLYPSASALTADAAQRLSALSDYTELGAGFKVAMRDLEIRGAGNLLGDEQSGHVAALGFELYMQMLDEAVQEMGGEDGTEELAEPVRLDVNVDAYVPVDYIPYEQAKIDVHRRIAGAREVSELHELRSELADRFGEPPEPLRNLLLLQQARIKLGEAGARAVSFRGGRLAVTPIELDSRRAKRMREEIPEALYESGKSQLSVRVPDDPAARFPAVVRAADVLLAVTREAA